MKNILIIAMIIAAEINSSAQCFQTEIPSMEINTSMYFERDTIKTGAKTFVISGIQNRCVSVNNIENITIGKPPKSKLTGEILDHNWLPGVRRDSSVVMKIVSDVFSEEQMEKLSHSNHKLRILCHVDMDTKHVFEMAFELYYDEFDKSLLNITPQDLSILEDELKSKLIFDYKEFWEYAPEYIKQSSYFYNNIMISFKDGLHVN